MSPCAILVTDRQLLPTITGNRLRILGVMTALRSLGWKVVLVALSDVAPLKELRSLVDGFVAVPARPFAGGPIEAFDPAPFRRAVESAVRKFKAAIVVAEYAWLAPALARLPRWVRRVVDCHDVLHERTERFQAAGLHPWAICTREQELRRLELADVVLATQEREAAILRALLPRRQVACILTPITLPPGFSRTSPPGHTVLTVGANHPGNLAVADFARIAWPRVLARVPDAELHVVGGVSSIVPDVPRVRKWGQVPDVTDHYLSASIVVCPVSVGTGVKTKMLEALRFGRAVVVTPLATEGMPKPLIPTWVEASSLEDCADAVADLLLDPDRRRRLEPAAFEFGERFVGERPFKDQIAAALAPSRFTMALGRFLL